MTITKLLAEGLHPSHFAERFMRRITELEPLHAFTKSAVIPSGAYILPFVDGKGNLKAWVPFASKPNCGTPVYVTLESKDPNEVWRVTEEGVVRVSRAANEDS